MLIGCSVSSNAEWTTSILHVHVSDQSKTFQMSGFSKVHCFVPYSTVYACKLQSLVLFILKFIIMFIHNF